MPMKREDHENLLNELLNPELETSRKTEILQSLRVDYSGVHTDFQKFEEDTAKLRADNDDLIVSNSKLFREIGISGNKEMQKDVEEKEFSETITLEDLERGAI